MPKRRYRSQAEAERIRTEACRMAAQIIAADGEWEGDASKRRLWSLCVFFETYVADGASKTARMMDMGDELATPKPRHAPVVRLITRDD